MAKVFTRSGPPFNYDTEKASDESGLQCLDVSLAHQSFAEEVDINTIIKRFGIGYQMPQGLEMPVYQDFEGIFDFHSAMNSVAKANEVFDQLSAEVRARFHNNPGDFVAFCLDEKNRQEAIRLGLVRPKAVAEPAPSPVAPAAAVGAVIAPVVDKV